MTDLDRLDELAAATTGEPWDFADWLTAENHEYIAACDPATIRSLVAEVRRADDMREAANGLRVYARHDDDCEFTVALRAQGRSHTPCSCGFDAIENDYLAALHHKDGAS